MTRMRRLEPGLSHCHPGALAMAAYTRHAYGANSTCSSTCVYPEHSCIPDYSLWPGSACHGGGYYLKNGTARTWNVATGMSARNSFDALQAELAALVGGAETGPKSGWL